MPACLGRTSVPLVIYSRFVNLARSHCIAYSLVLSPSLYILAPASPLWLLSGILSLGLTWISLSGWYTVWFS